MKTWLYRAPTILHSKFVIVDDAINVIGPSNIDMRSFSLNLEVSVLMASPHFMRKLDALFVDYRANSRELTLSTWHKRPWYARFIEGLARLTATVQ